MGKRLKASQSDVGGTEVAVDGSEESITAACRPPICSLRPFLALPPQDSGSHCTPLRHSASSLADGHYCRRE